MKRFMLKSSLFICPFLLIYFLNTQVYVQNQGDLARLGYLYRDPSPSKDLIEGVSAPDKAIKFSDLNFDSNVSCDVFVIGDSFSDQGDLGYVNYLTNHNLNVVHFDRFFTDNPILMASALLNGGVLETIQPKYIVLQSVERMFVPRCLNFNYEAKYTVDDIKAKIRDVYDNEDSKESITRNSPWFLDDIIKIPMTNIAYLFKDKPEYAQTYKIASTSNTLFSGNPENILVYPEDIDNLVYKNDTTKIAECNTVLNRIDRLLAEKNIQLIVLISPDKYDIFYPYFENSANYIKPIFFEHFNTLEKNYEYVNAMDILSEEIKKEKDIYYYDDTHWSFKGANIMAQEIKETIDKSKKRHQARPVENH